MTKRSCSGILTIVLLLMTGIQMAFAQEKYFHEIAEDKRGDLRLSGTPEKISKFSLYRISLDGLRLYLSNAPLEFTGAAGLQLEIPLPYGESEVFNMVESPILSPEVAQKHPEIKTYSGTGTRHKNYSVRINLTTNGFSAIILGFQNDVVYFEKGKKGAAAGIYISYLSRDAIKPENKKIQTSPNRCGTLNRIEFREASDESSKQVHSMSRVSTGATLRTFRLAMAADAEFTANKGGTQSAAFAALTNYVNNLNAVYRKELSVAFVLVSDASIVYTNAATDPYDNNSQEAMLGQNQSNLDNVIGAGNYDIGHVLGYAGGSGGGLASNPVVCQPGSKAEGTSGLGDGSFAEVFDFQLIAHEIGHQFGMSHSYNSNVPVCLTRVFETSVEPGAGTTIMSYGFTCSNTNPAEGLVGADDYEAAYAPFLNFHIVNLDQANDYIATISCFTSTSTGNAIPVIAPMQTSYTIPKSTPFALSGMASDADAGDVLSYSWEGTNKSDEPTNSSLTATTISDVTKPPFFRSYAPVPADIRNYPRLSAILDGSNYAKGDKLPAISIATTHTLTVRDDRGGVVSENVTVNIDGNSGPFLITNDPTGNHRGGESMTVEWSVNGTATSPINATLVDIWLSTDGGQTFPTALASGIPNVGTANVVLPTLLTTQARIKVAPSVSTASGNSPNIFFDISNTNFAIDAPLPVTLLSFYARVKEESTALLTWETAQEINNAGFEIEMSSDEPEFVKLGFVAGQGNSAVRRQYQYAATNLENGIYFFRLKQIDYNGRFEYSPVRKVEIQHSKEAIAVYPNPAGGKIRLNPGAHNHQAFSIRIVDQAGRVVLTLPGSTRYTNGYELDITSLAAGSYHLILTGKDFTESLRFVKR